MARCSLPAHPHMVCQGIPLSPVGKCTLTIFCYRIGQAVVARYFRLQRVELIFEGESWVPAGHWADFTDRHRDSRRADSERVAACMLVFADARPCLRRALQPFAATT